MYQLIADYTTGNSFGSEEETDVIHNFESKEVAIAAMKRLQEHYKWYIWDEKSEYDKQRAINSWKEKPVDKPEWHTHEHNFQASYYLDNGNLFTDCMPYCGYFETLHSLEVKGITEDKVEF